MKVRGFTLVELAVTLAVIALVLGMLVIPLSTQFEQQRIAETQKQLTHVHEAVLGFTIANGRLPCPATPTTATGTAGAGTENKPGASCGISEGVLPWAALGVPEADGWNRRFTYRVTLAFADDPSGMQASFLITDAGNITVQDGSLNNIAVVPALIVSHGKNGFGAFRTDGTQVAGASGHELENADNDLTFITRTHAPDFDDILTWISANVLKSRMVAANRLP